MYLLMGYGILALSRVCVLYTVHTSCGCVHQGQDGQGFTVVRGQFLQKRDRIDSLVWNQLVSSMLQKVVLVSAYYILVNSSPEPVVIDKWCTCMLS